MDILPKGMKKALPPPKNGMMHTDFRFVYVQLNRVVCMLNSVTHATADDVCILPFEQCHNVHIRNAVHMVCAWP